MPDPNEESAPPLLQASQAVGKGSTHSLIDSTYEELRSRAHCLLGPRSAQWEATAIVHEAYLRLAQQQNQEWQTRAHFVAISSTFLRRVLVDAVRAESRSRERCQLTAGVLQGECVTRSNYDLLDLDAALTALAGVDKDAARVVELRFFRGLTIREIATETEMPKSSVQDLWTFARIWLGQRLKSLNPST